MAYYPIQIIIIVSILYLFTFLLTKKKILSIANHRKVWNILLLISFLLTAVLGVFMATQITMDWPNWNIRGLHVNPGVAMVTICVYHILWHIPYLKNVLKFR